MRQGTLIHPPSLALAEIDASPPRPKAGDLVHLSLLACPAAVVARRLRCSRELVTGWAHGKSAPNLNHLLGAPPAFSLRLVALTREAIDLRPLIQRDPHEAVALLLCSLGSLLLMTKRPLEELSIEELREVADKGRAAEEQGATVAREAEAVLARKLAEKKEAAHG